MLSASGSRLEREPRTLPRWYRAGCLLTRCRKRPQRASTCAYAKGIEKREEEKRKSELCFRFDLRDDHDDDATILILDKYPFATSNELSFHLSISNLSRFDRETTVFERLFERGEVSNIRKPRNNYSFLSLQCSNIVPRYTRRVKIVKFDL